MSITKKLYKEKTIKNVNPWIIENIQYETIMGSQAYGVSSDNSDLDLYGFTIPPKSIVFPHTAGHIMGFDTEFEKFKVYQQHHIKSKESEVDVTIYNIVDYFKLLTENNPNIIDSLFTRQQSVTHQTKIAQMVRDKRHIFLHKGAWHRFKGYAYSQMKKLRIKNPDQSSKRYESIQKYGYDVKFAYHIVRLLNEVEQILMYGDIDLMQNNEQLKDIRAGYWYLDEIEKYFQIKEVELEKLYLSSTLRKYPDKPEIKTLLLSCLEEFYGDLNSTEITTTSECDLKLQKIKNVLDGRL